MLFAGLLPAGLRVAEADPSATDPTCWPDAFAPVARAIRHRQQEYVCARLLARELLTGLGRPGVCVGTRPDRAPIWPAGVVGGITHTSRRDGPGWVAVAVAEGERVRGIGLDVEPDLPLPDGVERMVVFPGDSAAVGVPARALFSAKEAVYKAIYPSTGEIWGFDAVRVRVEGDGGLVVDLARPAPGLPVGTRLRGRWGVANGFVGTAFVIPAAEDAPPALAR